MLYVDFKLENHLFEYGFEPINQHKHGAEVTISSHIKQENHSIS